MKNKSLLLIGFASLVIITASSFQLSNSNFEKNKIVKETNKISTKHSKTDLANALSEKLGAKKPVVASLTKHGIEIKNATTTATATQRAPGDGDLLRALAREQRHVRDGAVHRDDDLCVCV